MWLCGWLYVCMHEWLYVWLCGWWETTRSTHRVNFGSTSVYGSGVVEWCGGVVEWCGGVVK